MDLHFTYLALADNWLDIFPSALPDTKAVQRLLAQSLCLGNAGKSNFFIFYSFFFLVLSVLRKVASLD